MRRIVPSSILCLVLPLTACHRVDVPIDSKCFDWQRLRERAIIEEAAKNFVSAADYAERSVRVRLACDRSGKEQLEPEMRARAAHDLLRAGEFLYIGGQVHRGRMLVRESIHEFDRALTHANSSDQWAQDAEFEISDAEDNVEHDAWPDAATILPGLH